MRSQRAERPALPRGCYTRLKGHFGKEEAEALARGARAAVSLGGPTLDILSSEGSTSNAAAEHVNCSHATILYVSA